ncbi:phage tail protein I [Lysobacter arvi]|uniref:phage tail protein I n=1 Tax=Lysobacter arvi TaxID=3038776 RepID=UPI00283AB160|nr:phage tail protein I [Lysobacter arvi]
MLPPNATPLMRALEEVGAAHLARIDVPTRDLWNPDTCPEPLLPWLAYSVSIDTWQSYWPEPVKRERIRRAIAIQRHKGTVGAVKAAVASFGATVVLREWWQQQPHGAPHTFTLTLNVRDLNGQPASARFVDDVIAEVRRVKPARSHFTFTQGVQAGASIGIVAAARMATHVRLRVTGAAATDDGARTLPLHPHAACESLPPQAPELRFRNDF